MIFLSRHSFKAGDFKISGYCADDMVTTLDTKSIYIKNTPVTNITLRLNGKEESVDVTHAIVYKWSRGLITVSQWLNEGGSSIRVFDNDSNMVMTIAKLSRTLEVTIDPDLFHLYRNDFKITIVRSRVKQPPPINLAKLIQTYLDKLIER